MNMHRETSLEKWTIKSLWFLPLCTFFSVFYQSWSFKFFSRRCKLYECKRYKIHADKSSISLKKIWKVLFCWPKTMAFKSAVISCFFKMLYLYPKWVSQTRDWMNMCLCNRNCFAYNYNINIMFQNLYNLLWPPKYFVWKIWTKEKFMTYSKLHYLRWTRFLWLCD